MNQPNALLRIYFAIEDLQKEFDPLKKDVRALSVHTDPERIADIGYKLIFGITEVVQKASMLRCNIETVYKEIYDKYSTGSDK